MTCPPPRRLTPLAAAVAFACALASPAFAAPKKIVVLAGDLDSHPAGTHEYEKAALLIQHCLQTAKNLPEPPKVEVHFHGWPQDEATLTDADSLVIVSGGSDRREADHPLFVGNHLEVVGRQMSRGCGLVLFHWSTFAPLRAKGQLLEWIGGFFDYESGPEPRRWLSAIDTKPAWDVRPGTPGHPVLRGVAPFALPEEFYHHLRFAENDARRVPLLAVGDPAEPANVVGWGIERADGGRGFGFTGGHFFANWEVPDFRRAVLNGIAWTAKIDIPEGGLDTSTKPIPETRGAEVWKARPPLEPALWPQAGHPVNRDRLYDFYAKEADFFATHPAAATLLLPEYPGLDGGTHGHWGNQNEDVWKDSRWNASDLGSAVANVWRGANMTVPKGVAVRLGDTGALAAVFNPTTATFDAVWRGGFVTFSDIRHGFMDGATLSGTPLLATRPAKPPLPLVYHGYYRHGRRIVFAYRSGEAEWLDSAWEEHGTFTRTVAPAEAEELARFTHGGPAQWPQVLETQLRQGTGGDGTFVIDTLELPFDNPLKALFFVTGHDFFPDRDSAALCTMTGDVWTVSGLDDPQGRLRWRRFATGLHQPLGLKIADGEVCVLGRDQITRLHDLNGDGEADFHECVSNAYDTSPGGHDFITGLERDAAGAWYFASATQGLCRLAPGAAKPEVIATGFRNANGVALDEDGTLLTNGQEGEWSNASMIFQPKAGGYYGYGGPKNGEPPAEPLLYLPRGFDNSTGSDVFLGPDAWKAALGPNFVHLSWGAGTASLVLRDVVAGQAQGLAVALPSEFRSGAHRVRFRAADGHLYVSGMQGWGSYTPDDGCFQRVRLVGKPLLPVAWEACDNGVKLRFSAPVDPLLAADATKQFAQVWTYRYAADYGSPEYSVRHPGEPGHDVLAIRSAHVIEDGAAVFLEIPELRPVKQLHLRLRVGGPRPLDLFATVHALHPPWTQFPGYQPVAKTATPEAPLLAAPPARENPWKHGAPGRAVRLEAALGLQFATKSLTCAPGERLSLTFVNPDAIPHNFVLVRPGALAAVGERINRLIAEPGAAARHYVPEGPDVLVWCDMTNPSQSTTIHFTAPSEKGDYPFLCSFPGHWQAMNGVLSVR